MLQETFTIGKIVNTHGIKGMTKVYPYVEDITRFKDMKQVYLKINNELVLYDIESSSVATDMALIKFKGIDNIDDAKKYKDTELVIYRKDADELDEDEYYISDLIGMEMFDVDTNNIFGKLIDVIKTGSNDVYVIKMNDGKELLLPVIKEVVKEVNLETRCIKVHIMEGLM